MEHEVGSLAFFGGPSWGGPDGIERELLELAGGVVTVLPAGAAYERPERVVNDVRGRFEPLGASVRVAPVLNRRDAEERSNADALREASFILLVGGSPLHLRSVLKDSAVLAAIVGAWREGAVVAGSAGGAMVLSDPMVDPRGGAFTVGLGLVRDLSVVTGASEWMSPGLRRTLSLAPDGCAVVSLGEHAAVVRSPDGTWSSEGEDLYVVYLEGEPVGLDVLAGKSLF